MHFNIVEDHKAKKMKNTCVIDINLIALYTNITFHRFSRNSNRTADHISSADFFLHLHHTYLSSLTRAVFNLIVILPHRVYKFYFSVYWIYIFLNFFLLLSPQRCNDYNEDEVLLAPKFVTKSETFTTKKSFFICEI